MSESARNPVARRTHAERSAETRARLLDAAIECLIEEGYAAMSTTEVVARAGLSRGAQVHHFPRKVDLVEAAVQWLLVKTAEDVNRTVAQLPADADRGETVLSLLWSAFRSPLFLAALELIVAARTDDTLIPGLRALQFEINDTISRVCVDLYGPGAGNSRALQQAVDLSFTFFHGLGASTWINDEGWQNEQLTLWKRTIRPLLEQAERELVRSST
jgi:AcrR family transcriptional regulator